MEALGDQTHFIVLNSAIEIAFGTKNSFTANQTSEARRGNQGPGFGLQEGLELTEHSLASWKIFRSFSKRMRFIGNGGRGGSQVSARWGPEDSAVGDSFRTKGVG